MNDTDDAAGGSGDDWEITLSPSISSLSSFTPDDFSFPLQQHLQTTPTPAPKREPPPPPHPPSPQKHHHQQQHHYPQQQTHQQKHDSPQKIPPSQQRDQTPQKTRPLHPHQISIPVPNLHTPPPTSPRRRPGSLLARSASMGVGPGPGGLATPTNTHTTNMGTARLGLLHTGVGAPGSPLAAASSGSGSGLGLSPLREQRGGVSWPLGQQQQEEEDLEGGGQQHSRVHSLSQSWSDISMGGGGGGNGSGAEGQEEEEEGKEGGGEEGEESGLQSQRHSWDSVATLRDATAAYVYHHEQDDADDEAEGSRTRVGEGVGGYEPSRGYDGASYGLEGSKEHEVSQGEKGQQLSEGSRVGASSPLKQSPQSYDFGTQSKGGDAVAKGSAVGDEGDKQGQGKWHEGVSESPGEETEGDTLPPGRVMLMERLCDLVQRLSSVRVGGGMEADVIDVLNAKVDEMEDLLVLAEETAEAEATAEVDVEAGAENQPDAEDQAEAEAEMEAEGFSEVEPRKEGEQEPEARAESEAQSEQAKSGYGEDSRCASGRSSAMLPTSPLPPGDQAIHDLASPLPWLTSTFKFSELSISPSSSHPELAAATNEALEAAKQAAQAQADMAEQVAYEAEKINRELFKLVKKLQSRKEESDHLHAILIDRAECAATRILDLEKEVCDLEDDILCNESELRHLRLKIRAVETLCYEFVHPDADPELFESIENWKADWVLVRDRMRERKKDRQERRLRLHRAGCVINSLEGRENDTSLTSLGGLSMSVSLLGLGGGQRKGY